MAVEGKENRLNDSGQTSPEAETRANTRREGGNRKQGTRNHLIGTGVIIEESRDG